MVFVAYQIVFGDYEMVFVDYEMVFVDYEMVLVDYEMVFVEYEMVCSDGAGQRMVMDDRWCRLQYRSEPSKNPLFCPHTLLQYITWPHSTLYTVQ